MAERLSVAIAGGGPAGAAAAIALARAGVPAVVFEAAAGPQAKIGESLPPGAGPLLRRLGLAERIEHGGHFRTYGNRSAWGQASVLERDFLMGAYGAGWRLDRYAFEESLARAAIENGVEWRYGSTVRQAEWRAGAWHLNVARGSASCDCLAQFLIDATGRRASLARQLGARRVNYGGLVGIGAELDRSGDAAPRDTFTSVEAVPSGWWYSSLLPNGRLLAVFMTDHDLPEFRAAKDGRQWRRMLRRTEHISRHVRNYGFRLRRPLRSYPADTVRLTEIAGEHWLAAGDAAAAYDPLSSHGIVTALASGYYAGRAAADLLCGAPDARIAYVSLMEKAFGVYLSEWADCYRIERRWPKHPFWQRRHNRPPF
jgi:flavin-dependent dehydrogenase